MAAEKRGKDEDGGKGEGDRRRGERGRERGGKREEGSLKILPQRRAEKSVEFCEAVHNPVIRQGDLILLEDTHLLWSWESEGVDRGN